MSAQFGQWNFDAGPIDPGYFERARAMIAPYGPDGDRMYTGPGIAIAYAALHTTSESRKETQPYVCGSGAVLVWDGRLDNRSSLIAELGGNLDSASTDVEIVARAWDRWQTQCFAKFVGDWALVIWQPQDRSLTLAKDPIGARHLYYTLDERRVIWSTTLDPLVRLQERALDIDEEYIAGWLAFFPAADRTPYARIQAVPPSCILLVRNRRHTTYRYWDFDQGKRIRYRTDSEYEEHFRTAFRESVRRRLRSGGPIVAELSGGIDSASIVCVADDLIAYAGAERVALDTVSYYTDDEPHWNERPYFTCVEARRGQAGCHIDVSQSYSSAFESESDEFRLTPASGSPRTRAAKQFAAFMALRPSRVLLSGIGGDEVTGGAPAGTPGLADLLATFDLRELAHQLKRWALETHRPWFHLFVETACRFLPCAIAVQSNCGKPARWLNRSFVRRHAAAFSGYQSRLRLFGALPSFQDNIGALDGLRRQLACAALPINPIYEKRYPYLDRDFLEFLFSIPRQQLVRAGERRSLMRRALRGIVPDEVLNRRRKAFAARGPRVAVATECAHLAGRCGGSSEKFARLVDVEAFAEALRRARAGEEVPLVPLLRTIGICKWLRSLDRESHFQFGGNRKSTASGHAEFESVRASQGFLS